MLVLITRAINAKPGVILPIYTGRGGSTCTIQLLADLDDGFCSALSKVVIQGSVMVAVYIHIPVVVV